MATATKTLPQKSVAAKTVPPKQGGANAPAVVSKNANAVAVVPEGMDFEQDAGAGREGADSDSYAIPFLTVLQKGSPQVDEASGVAIDGAKQGMLYNTVTGELMDGKEGQLFVPTSYKRVFLCWAPRDLGGGFKGEFKPEQIAAMREDGRIAELDGQLFAPLQDGSVNDKKCNRFKDTRNHYGLLLNDDGSFTPCLMSLSSTQVKKSKNLMSALANVKIKGKTGLYTPPTFANKVRVTTVPESNDKGNWMGVQFAIEGRVDSPDVYQAAKEFHAQFAKGVVTQDYEAAGAVDTGPEASDGGRRTSGADRPEQF